MKTLEFESQLDPHKKLITVLFWINRKSARTEGCAPFLIKKITTEENVYTPEGRKLLKLNEDIMEDLVRSVDEGRIIELEISMGKEFIKAKLEGNKFSVSTKESEEIEDEIIEKLEMELGKNYPSVCQSFIPRVTPRNKQ